MAAIIMEGVLVVALVVATGTLLFFGLTTFTPLGRRMKQPRERDAVGQGAARICPIHGPLTEDALVRLPTGETVCSKCFTDSA